MLRLGGILAVCNLLLVMTIPPFSAAVLLYNVSVFNVLSQKLNFMQVSHTKHPLLKELPDLQDQEVKTNSWKLFYLSLIYSFQRVYNSSVITPGALLLLSHTHAHTEPFIFWCLRLLGFISKSIHLVEDALIAPTVSINLLLSSDNCRRWWLHQPLPSSANGKVLAPLL